MQQYNMQNQPTFNQIQDNRIKIKGIENARLYPIAPNVIETLWDIDNETFYVVSAGTEPKVYTYKEKYSVEPYDNKDVISTVFENNNIIENNKNENGFEKLEELDNRLRNLSDEIDIKMNNLLDNIKTQLNAINDKLIDTENLDNVIPPQTKNRSMSKTNKGGK